MSVLVVDDDRDLRAFVVSVLQEEGHLVQTACNGKEGLDQVMDNPPDLILLDLHMPVMDGGTLCRLLRQHPKTLDIPIILMSADVWETCPDLGIQHFLRKPFDLDSFLGSIRSFSNAGSNWCG